METGWGRVGRGPQRVRKVSYHCSENWYMWSMLASSDTQKNNCDPRTATGLNFRRVLSQIF